MGHIRHYKPTYSGCILTYALYPTLVSYVGSPLDAYVVLHDSGTSFLQSIWNASDFLFRVVLVDRYIPIPGSIIDLQPDTPIKATRVLVNRLADGGVGAIHGPVDNYETIRFSTELTNYLQPPL